MDADRVKGKAKDLLGQGKETTGDLTNDRDLQAEGQGDQAEGKTQETFGKAKDKVRDVINDVKR